MKKYCLCIAGALPAFFCLSACEREFRDAPLPLRPLVYTEMPQEREERKEEGEPEQKFAWVAPEDLGLALFHAIVTHDRQAYEALFVSGEELSALIRSPIEDAEKQSRLIIEKSEKIWTLFSPKLIAEEPLGGLNAGLKLADFRIGKGRVISGKIATSGEDEVVQHWGNDIIVELAEVDKSFKIRLPKMVKTSNGWRIASAIEIDNLLQVYLEAGMHLKNDLMLPEHYPYPLEVGNYWQYSIEFHAMHAEESIAEETEESPLTTVKITDIEIKQGYKIVGFERSDQSKNPPEITQYSYLVTPKRIYHCLRECRNHGDNPAYLLAYMTRQTPIYIFPLQDKQIWGKNGQKNKRYEVSAQKNERWEVKSGSYAGGFEISGASEEGRESRFFVSGTGVIKRIVRSGSGSRVETLVKIRLIN